jgi:hypothetical protein
MGAAAALQNKPPRDYGFQPGKSGNPGGIPRGVRQLQQLISLAHGPKILTALQKLFELGMDESTVTAVDRKGEAHDVPRVEMRTRVQALEVFVAKTGELSGIVAAARQVAEEPVTNEAELLERVVDGILRKPETRELVASKLVALQGGKP